MEPTIVQRALKEQNKCVKKDVGRACVQKRCANMSKETHTCAKGPLKETYDLVDAPGTPIKDI